jgi:hypothetical protein
MPVCDFAQISRVVLFARCLRLLLALQLRSEHPILLHVIFARFSSQRGRCTGQPLVLHQTRACLTHWCAAGSAPHREILFRKKFAWSQPGAVRGRPGRCFCGFPRALPDWKIKASRAACARSLFAVFMSSENGLLQMSQKRGDGFARSTMVIQNIVASYHGSPSRVTFSNLLDYLERAAEKYRPLSLPVIRPAAIRF